VSIDTAARRGCTPTTSYFDVLLDERAAAMEMEIVMVLLRDGAANPNISCSDRNEVYDDG
jgi:hypothetical protein